MPITTDARGGRLGRKSSAEVFRLLHEEVISGSYSPGQFLPTERQLAAQHSVAQNTVRRALKALEAEKLIAAEPRQGYRVLARANDPHRGCPLAFLNWHTGPVGQWGSFDDHLMAELKTAADARGWSLLAMGIGSLSAEEVIERVTAARAFAAALCTRDEKTVEVIRRAGLPALMLDQWFEGADTDSVMQDGHQGGLLAARHLVGLGCRRIAWFGSMDRNAHSLARFGGASAGLMGEDLSLPPEMIHRIPDGGELEAARRMLAGKRRPDGVIALWQAYACAVKQAADERGLTVGKDFHMVGWCSEETIENTYRPGLKGGPLPPTITWSIRTMAETAVSRLAERREHPALPPLQIKIPVRLRLGT
jgi:DNA-binding LacI/PurR family transcriptional regulator